jgi:CUB/sushi domain-containing protein
MSIDNSNGKITFWVKPALKEEGTKMYTGNYTFTYVALDEVKNKAKCNFTLSIVDKTPPIFENCIENQTFYILSKNINDSIEWEEPFAYDNVNDKNVTVIKNFNSTILSYGEHEINYTAIDNAGNSNSCIVEISVKEKKCEELEKIENGQRICAKNDTMTWCNFQCNFDYVIMQNDSIVENVMMTCDLDKRIWSQDYLPDCMKIEQPTNVEEVLTISLNSDTLICEDYLNNVNQTILK